MIRIFILILCLVFSNNTFSQDDDLLVYPIRVDHKWGYAKFYGSYVDTLISPKYDNIGDVYLPWNVAGVKPALSPFRLFEIDKKVGLLNSFLQESLPNNYNRIRPISKEFYAVEIDEGFQLINNQEEVILDGEIYEDIKGERYDDRLQYFFVKKDRKWAVKNKRSALILGHQFSAIQSAGIPGFFKVKYKLNEEYWTLIDITGESLLPGKYAEIKMLNEKAITVRKEVVSRWSYFLSKNSDFSFVKQPGEFTSIKKVTDQTLALVPFDGNGPKKVLLQNLTGNFKVIKSLNVKVIGGSDSRQIVPDFFPLDENYGIQSFLVNGETSVRFKLIDPQGSIQSEFFDTIKTTQKDQVYFVARDTERGSITWRFWDILQPTNNNISTIKTKFSEISDFEDDIAITRIGNHYGAIAIVDNQKDELPCLFETVYKSGEKTLQVQTTSDKAVMYELNQEGKFTEDLIIRNTIVFSESKQRNIKEAEANQLRHIKKYVPDYKATLPFLDYTYEDGKLVILNKEETILRTNITKEVTELYEISADLLAVYFKGGSIQNKATKVFSEEPVAQVFFLSISKNKIINEVPMIGFRLFKEGYSYTTFLDSSAKMGLINLEGKQLIVDGKPLRYQYIGPFNAGRARICLGDQLYGDVKGDLKIPPRYSVGKVSELLDDFNIKIDGKITYGLKNGIPLYAINKKDNAGWGFIDEKGNLTIDPIYDYVKDFNDGSNRAIVYETQSELSGLKPKTYVGLINKRGETLIDFKDDFLNISYRNNSIKDSLFQITVGNTPTFYFNKKGHQVFVNPTKMRPFVEGLALFRSEENLWGYVDSIGNILIKPRFKYARPFSDGLAMVVDSSGFCSFINQKGDLVFKTKFTEKQQIGLGDFHEGLCWFKGTTGWFWGCFDKTGKEVIEPLFYHEITGIHLPKPAESYILPMDFINGVASVRVLDGNKKPVYTIIDINGNQKIKPGTYSVIDPFDENGVAVYSTELKGKKGLLNFDGKVLCPTRYKNIQSFENGFAKVVSGEGKWGLINLLGKEIVPPKFQEIGMVSEGMIPVKAKGRGWSFFDKTGEKVISGPFKSVTGFQNGISFVNREEKDFLIDELGNEIFISIGAPVFFSEGILGVVKDENKKRRNREYFYADDSGNNILGRNFKEISPFQLGVAKVRILSVQIPGEKKKKQLLGAINKRGVMIVPPKFRNLHLQPDGNIVINPQRFHGLVTMNGKTLLEPIYDLITYFPKDDIFRAEQGEKIGYFQLEENEVKWIWEMRY